MREFTDEGGRRWRALAREVAGLDYKGRWYLVFEALDDGPAVEVELWDVRWNSRLTAERTLATMADAELRRRLRWALGRARARAVGS